jgi:hypothetical protein
MVLSDELERSGIADSAIFEEAFRLFPILLQAGMAR